MGVDEKLQYSLGLSTSLGSESSNPPLEPENAEHLHQIITEGIEENMRNTTDDVRPIAP